MTNAELAAQYNNSEYGFEPKNIPAGMVVVFPYSDDNIEFCGAIREEFGAYGGVIIKLDRKGIYCMECEDENCPHECKIKAACPFFINQKWHNENGWSYETNIPNAAIFTIIDDDRRYGDGMVFSMSDLQGEPTKAN